MKYILLISTYNICPKLKIENKYYFGLFNKTFNKLTIYFFIFNNTSKCKVGTRSQGQPEGSIFNNYYTEV